MAETYFIAAAVSLVVFGGLGAWVADQRRRSAGEGFVLGALFGPLGVLIEALLPNSAAGPAKRSSGSSPRSSSSPLDEQVEREETDDAAISFLNDK